MTNLTATTDQPTELLLTSALTPTETEELQGCELRLRLAGLDRFEKALVVGEELSRVYNNALFRGPEGGRSWETYVKEVLPGLLPHEALSLDQCDRRRWLHEARTLLTAVSAHGPQPTTLDQALALQALLPRRVVGNSTTGQYHPLVTDEPDRLVALQEVWQQACEKAAEAGRAAPRREDVAEVVRRNRARLEETGQVRPLNAGLKAGHTAATERAAARATVDAYVSPEHTPEETKELRRQQNERAAEHARNERTKELKHELGAADREAEAELNKWSDRYGNALAEAVKACRNLKTELTGLSHVKGTAYLDELRSRPGRLTGFNYLANDLAELKKCGEYLVECVALAQSHNGPTSFEFETVNVEVV